MLSLMTESIEGVMEEVFTAMEHIKKRKNPLISVVHFFDVKYSEAYLWSGFSETIPFRKTANLTSASMMLSSL